MHQKKLIRRLRKKITFILRSFKVKFELWFLIALVLIVIFVFFIIQSLIGAIAASIQKSRYEVSLSDEKAIYTGISHEVNDDFSLLIEAQPSNLNGAPIKQNISKNQPTAVIIENYTFIRSQQAGLEGAAIIYESPTEGGITRFLAVYDGEPVDLIGPVRSARPYFITWASEYRAAFAHVGGSPAAINNLKSNFRVLNIDEFADGKTIWRDYKYLAPHNAYTSTNQMLQRLNKEKYYRPLNSKRFPFKEPDETSGDIRKITIGFLPVPYSVKYEYDPTDHRYSRYNGGKRHHKIKPANIIIQFVDTEILDEEGRLYIQTNGAGKALVFRDGKVIEGTWEKDGSINSIDQSINQSWTKFFDKDGNEIKLNRGQIWIEIVPNGNAVNYF